MKTYWLAARPYSLTASVVPVLLGSSLAKLLLPDLQLNGDFWLDFFLVMLGCLAVQALSNVVNDLVDFKTGLDSSTNSTKFKALVSGALTWRQMLGFAILLAVVSGAIGLYFIWLVGGPILWLVAGGGLLAIEYTAPPLKLKYRALGDLAVLLAFGLGMLFGAYVVIGHGRPDCLAPRNLLIVLIYALPSASLVVAILHANNHRDRAGDREAGARTLANSLPFTASKALLLALLIGPYVVALVASLVGVFTFGLASLWGLLVFATLPFLLRLLGPIRNDNYERTVPSVARLHGQFGLAMTLAVVAQILLAHASGTGLSGGLRSSELTKTQFTLAKAGGAHPARNDPEPRITNNARRQTVVVLTYHEVVPKRTADSLWFYCSAPELEGQLQAMEKAHVHFITLDQLYANLSHGTPLPTRPVCITFADNYEGYYLYALPILRRHSVPSAQFVHTGFVGSPIGRPKLTWEQLKEVDRAGDVTVASQTVTHPLDLRALGDERLRHEMADSKRSLEAHLGHAIYYLAYPNGKFDARCESAAQAAGYRMACSEVTKPANLSPSIFAVNRYVHTKWREALKRMRSER